MSAAWGETAIQTLRRMWAAGVTAQRISDALNLQPDSGGEYTRNGVIGKAHRLLLDRRPNPVGRTDPNRRTVNNPGGIAQAQKSRADDAHRTERRGSASFLFGHKAAKSPAANPPAPVVVPRRRVAASASTGRAEFRALAGSRLCMWIEGPTVPGSAHLAMTCGAATEPGCPWCARHRPRAWNGFKSPAQEAA